MNIYLSWKTFPVDLSRVRIDIKNTLSSNYDGLVASESQLMVVFFDIIAQQDRELIDSYWEGLTEESLAVPIPATLQEISRSNISFGQDLIAQFSAEQEINDFTTEQTLAAIDVLAPIQMMLLTGAIQTALITLQATDFAGIISQTLIDTYINKIQTHLGVL